MEELPALRRAIRIDRPVITDNPAGMTKNMCLKADECRAITRLKFLKIRPVNEPGNNFSNIIWFSIVHRHDTGDFLRIINRFPEGLYLRTRAFIVPAEPTDNIPCNQEAVGIILCKVFHKPGCCCMHFRACKLLLIRDFASCRAHQRSPAEGGAPPPLDANDIVAHSGKIGAACC